VILDKIFGWASEIERVPIKERLTALIQFILGYFAWLIILSQKDVVPEIVGQILSFDAQETRNWSLDISLQQMRNSVKRKVNRAVWQRFNQELLVKRHFGTQSKRSRTSPFSQPVYSVDQIIMESLAVALEVLLHMAQHSLFPVLVGVVEIPLVAVADYTDITRSRNDVASRLVVNKGISSIDQLLSDQTFGICNFGSFEVTNQHHSFMEPFFVSLILCLL
jgi:hypothetical protein